MFSEPSWIEFSPRVVGVMERVSQALRSACNDIVKSTFRQQHRNVSTRSTCRLDVSRVFYRQLENDRSVKVATCRTPLDEVQIHAVHAADQGRPIPHRRYLLLCTRALSSPTTPPGYIRWSEE